MSNTSTDQTTETETRHSWWVPSPSWDERNNYVPPHWEHSDEELVLRAIWVEQAALGGWDVPPAPSCATSHMLRAYFGRDRLAVLAPQFTPIAQKLRDRYLPKKKRQQTLDALRALLAPGGEYLHEGEPDEPPWCSPDDEFSSDDGGTEQRLHIWGAIDVAPPPARVAFSIELEKMFAQGVI